MKKNRIKKIIVITEGEFDSKLLKEILKDNNNKLELEFLVGSGFSSALSKAKIIISQDRIPNYFAY